MIKKIKESKFFSEKGSVTLFVLIAIIFFLIISLNIYSSNKNKIIAQSKEIQAIEENYNKDLENMDDIYENLTKTELKTVFIKQSSINSPNKVYYNLSEWTNENIIAKVTVYAENNPDAQLQVKVTSKKTGNTVTYNKNQVDNNEVIITENSTVIVTFGDKEEKFELTKFDKEIPVLSYEAFFTKNNGKYTSGTWTNKETYTKISIIEEISGIPEIYYSTDKQNWMKLNFNKSNGIYQELNKYCGKETWTLKDGRVEDFYFMAKDRAGNQSNISDVYQIRYDLTAPSKPTIENKYNDIWTNEEVVITAKSTDSLSKVSKIEYSYDEINWKTDWQGKLQLNGNEASISGTWNSNINGKIYVRATDNAGNISETSYTILKQDLIAPTVNITPNGNTYYVPNGGKTTIKAKLDAVDNESGLNILQYAWSTSNTIEPTKWETFENGKEIIKTNVTSGTYYLWTNVIDNAGNRATKIKVSNPFIVSSNASEAFKITITATPTTWTKDNVNVTITYGSGLTQGKKAGMGISIAEAQKVASENTAYQMTVTTNNYYIYAEALDSNGNKVTATKQITNIDKIAPTVELDKNGGTYIVAQNSSFVPITTKITAQDAGGSGLNNLQYQISSSTTIPADNDPNWKNFTNGATITENKAGGTWYLYTKVTDKAGNRATHIQKSNPFVVKYSVAYDANGGTGTMPTDSILYNTPYTTRANGFTREGYTFKGWNESPDGTGRDWTELIGKPWTWTYNRSITLYAQWISNESTLTVNPGGNTYTQKYGTTKQITAPEQYYTINFNSNGGSEVASIKATRPFTRWTLTGDGQINSETANPTTYTFGNGNGTLTASYSNTANAITLPTSTKWGYTIEGWYKDSSLTQLAGRAGEKYSPTSSGTLYAKWTINNYYLDFNTKVDGVEYIHGYNQRVYIGLKVDGVDKGYVDDYNTEHVFGTDWEVYGLRIDGVNINYTAKGKVGDYNNTLNGKTFIIVDLNNINISVNNSNYGSVSKNNMLILKGNTFTTNGTKLTLQDGRTVTASVKNDVGQITTFMGWTPSNGTVNEPTSIVANFTRNTSSSILTIKLNGGTINNSTNDLTFTKNYGEVMEITVPTPPKGYTVTFGGNGGEARPPQTSTKSFGGWSKTGAGTLEGNRFTFGAGDTVLFANYTNDSIVLPSTSRPGYTLTGWYDAITGGNRIGGAGDKYAPTSNIALYAQWEAGKYTLTVNPNGGIWNGTTGISTFSQDFGTTKTIANPTVPAGYKVTFNGNGGSTPAAQTSTKSFTNWTNSGAGTLSGTTYTFGAGNGTLTANYKNNSITLPSSSRAGYTFLGWYDAPVGGNKIGDAGSAYTSTTTKVLYAQWKVNQYTLTVNPNGGTWNGTTASSTFTQSYGSTKAISNPTAPAGYKVTFNGNGGSTPVAQTSTKSFTSWTNNGAGTLSGTIYTFGAGNGTLTANYKNNAITLPTPTRTGYTFAGWYDAASGGNKVGDGGSLYTPTTAKTLYAHWIAGKYTLTVNPNGGTWNGTTMNSTFSQDFGTTKTIVNPTAPAGYKVTFNGNGGSTPVAQTSTKSFTNWSHSGAGSLSGTTYTFGAGNGTLTANYKNNSITLPTPTRTGYTFAGWYDAASGGNKVGDGGAAYTPTGAKTLYAHWTANQYTLTVNPNGGTWHETTTNSTFTQDYGTTKEIANPTAPAGYTVTFNGNGGNSIAEMTSVKRFTNWEISGAGSLNGTTYTFGAGDGTLTACYENNSIILPIAIRAGYTFEGWYDSINGGNRIGDSGEEYTPTSEKTLYAHWTINQYTLTVNPNGGTWNGMTANCNFTQNYGTTKEITNPTAPEGYKVTFDGNGGSTPSAITSSKRFTNWINSGAGSLSGTTYTFGAGNGTLTANYTNNDIILPLTTREGHTFEGWYDAAIGGNRIGNANEVYKPSESKTLYAHWTTNQYTLTIDPNGGKWNNLAQNSIFAQDYGTTVKIEDPIPPEGYTVIFNGNGGNNPATITSMKRFTNWQGSGAGTLSGGIYTFGAGDGRLTAYYENNSIVLPFTTRTGYIFDGWYDSINGGNKIGEAGENYTPIMNETLYAKWRDDTLPFIGMLTSAPTSWTNGNVTLTGKAQDLGSGISYYQFSTNANLTSSSSGWTQIPNTKNEIVKTHTVTTNGTYYFYVKDASGKVNKKSIVVSNIDKVLPTVQFNLIDGKYSTPKHNYRNVDIIVKLTAADDLEGSGLNQLQYSWSRSENTEPTSGWINFTNDTNMKISSSAGKWYLWTKVTDNAGNTTTQKEGPFIVWGWEAEKIGEWYYYGEKTGEKLKGWQYVYHDEGLKDNKYWYYLQPDKNGLMTLGWASIDGYWYWFNDTVTEEVSGGEMQVGWKKINGKWFYFKKDGDGVTWDGPEGSMLTGWQSINGNWYYLLPKNEGSNPERKCSNWMERN